MDNTLFFFGDIMYISLLFSTSSFFACSEEKIEDSATPSIEELSPTYYCPGSEGCPDADGVLRVGAAAVPITPTCYELWRDCGDDGLCPEDEGYVEADSNEGNGEWERNTEVFLDCGCDQLCPGDEGYTAPDEGEADQDFQASWIAGFQNSRPANGVHDDIWARAIVFEKGSTRVGFVVVDLVGWFYQEIEKTRTIISDEGIDLDHLIVSSTHTHEAPDTMGLWGRSATSTGYSEEYAQYVRLQSTEAIRLAVDNLQDVGSFAVGAVDVRDYAENGTSNLVRDSRDPQIVDEQMRAAIFRNTSGETIATLSHFGNHPEVLADENTLITSDFPDLLRTSLETGVVYDSYTRDGYGGVSIFVNGSVGGLMTPLGITIVDGEGNSFREYTFEKNDAFGKVMAEQAMDAIDGAQEATDDTLSFSAQVFDLPVENFGFQAMFVTNIIPRDVFGYDPSEIIDDVNIPYVRTEVAHLRVGPLSFVTVPGEIAPELVIGGYDGSHIGDPEKQLVDDGSINPPDLSLAPQGPYIQDIIPSSHPWVVGMGNDELGYIIPEYDFQIDDRLPWFDEAEGDHYEETRSLSSKTAELVQAELQKLMDWSTRE
jgi:hypothetical protein